MAVEPDLLCLLDDPDQQDQPTSIPLPQGMYEPNAFGSVPIGWVISWAALGDDLIGFSQELIGNARRGDCGNGADVILQQDNACHFEINPAAIYPLPSQERD